MDRLFFFSILLQFITDSIVIYLIYGVSVSVVVPALYLLAKGIATMSLIFYSDYRNKPTIYAEESVRGETRVDTHSQSSISISPVEDVEMSA